MLPFRRDEVCPGCNADLHVCKLCTFYNTAVADACDEPIAAAVSNKERANFCDYFKPSTRAWHGAADSSRVRAELDALFGGGGTLTPSSDGDANRAELERIFGLKRE